MGSVEFLTPWAHVDYILTHPFRRQQGIGSKLLHRFSKEEQEAGRAFMVLWSDERDAENRIAFFVACGFEPVPHTQFLGVPIGSLLVRTAL